MGNQNSLLTYQEMHNYKRLTYLEEDEIARCRAKYLKIVNRRSGKSKDSSFITRQEFNQMEQFKVNPFCDRIFTVFASHPSQMTFDELLNLFSVFSEAAPEEVKADYAFRIYDVQNRDLGRSDVRVIVEKLVHKDSLDKETMNLLLEKIFEEADTDRSQTITVDEFKYIVSRSSEFSKTFCVRV